MGEALMAGSLLGTAVLRVEDPELLTGAARFVDDLKAPGCAIAWFVRSPYAHAIVGAIDIEAALAVPGVVAVLTASDLAAPATASMLHPAIVRTPLASGTVRYVGEPVALVIAESTASALDGAEAVAVDYEPLDAVADVERALDDTAPVLFAELGSNIARGFREREAGDVLAGADVVVRARLANRRMAVAPMEPSAILVEVGGPGDGFALTVHAGSQMPFRVRDALVAATGLGPSEIRVAVPYVGGGFGGKGQVPVEYVAVTLAARRLSRAVKWCEARSDNLVSMTGRGQVHFVEMGFTSTGEVVGLRGRLLGDAGAYGGFGGILVEGPTRNMSTGPYRIPRLSIDTIAVLTNTSSVVAFRGAGRPEAAELLERLMDLGADALGIDPAEIRRINLLERADFPFRTLTGMLYDSGDYARPLAVALERAGYRELRAEQAARLAAGSRTVLGIGVSTYVEITAPGGASAGEFGAVDVGSDGTATVRVGTTGTGQGHATVFGTIVADRLGLPLEAIRFVQADTAATPTGGGTVGSRSLQLAGAAVGEAAVGVLHQAVELAAELLEAAIDDVVQHDDGRIGVVGVPSSALSWSELATAAAARGRPLAEEVDFRPAGATFPFGAHVSVVEVDLETGRVMPLRHVAVDDAGTIVNPMIAAGQQHGGVLQGMAQALWEEASYDGDGTPLTSTFATYCIPSAAEACSFEVENTETPTPYNALGAKGIGESATIGATPAVHNAVIDALSHLGVRHLDLPCTPERVWRAVRDAEAGRFDDSWSEPPRVFSSLEVRGGADHH